MHIFREKSVARMKKLAMSGCTLLLVSHSIQQILQFCERVIWIEKGQIVMDDKALKVIRAYENFSKKLEYEEKLLRQHGNYSGVLSNTTLQKSILKSILSQSHQEEDVIPEISTEGLSRWQGKGCLRIDSIRILNNEGRVSRKIEVGRSAEIEFTVCAEKMGKFPVIFVIVIYNIEDELITRHISKKFELKFNIGEKAVIKIMFSEILFGPGHYYFSSAIYSRLDMNKQNEAEYYDLLNRAIEFEVVTEDSNYIDLVKQPGEWSVNAEEVMR